LPARRAGHAGRERKFASGRAAVTESEKIPQQGEQWARNRPAIMKFNFRRP
jgi:hypothetical protein